MSIQASINQALGSAAQLKKLSELSDEQKKTREEMERQYEREHRFDLTDEELEAGLVATGIPDDDTVEDIIVRSDDEKEYLKARLGDEGYNQYLSGAYKGLMKQSKESIESGMPYTQATVQDAQMAMYRNLANLRLGKVAAKKAAARTGTKRAAKRTSKANKPAQTGIDMNDAGSYPIWSDVGNMSRETW